MRFFIWFENLDRRILYLLVVATLFYPLMRPLGLPVGLSETTQVAYDTIERLQPGDIALLSPSYTPGTIAENLPQTVVFARHLMKRGVRIVGVATRPDAAMFNDQVLKTWAPVYGYEYGRDYVVLPFMAGDESYIISMGRVPFSELHPVDFYGNSTVGTVVDDIKTVYDIDCVVDMLTGDSLTWYIRQLNASFGTVVTGGSTAVGVPGLMVYYASGQLSGLLGGLKGAAEYEVLANTPGTAASGMDAQSLSHLLIVFFVLIGNVAYLARRKAAEQ
ncbi:MAG: hypothetical protein Q8P31_14190 [Bacillota bacterium]|nr:hypothetical protein [Bacillota bacterium]